jgi:AcrR family transcriptional regulator
MRVSCGASIMVANGRGRGENVRSRRYRSFAPRVKRTPVKRLAETSVLGTLRNVERNGDHEASRVAVLDAAEALFYQHGVQAVGMDAIRDRSGVPLKRLYATFGSKDALVVAMLERRDVRWRLRLAQHVEQCGDPGQRPLSVFEWLELWFSEPEFRGCAWINTFGELGGTSPAIVEQARRHKRAFARFIDEVCAEAGFAQTTADALYLLAEGAMVTAGIFGDATPATRAQETARRLLEVS